MRVCVLAQMGLSFRRIVLVQSALDVIGLTDVEAAFRIFEDVDEIFGHEKSVTLERNAFNEEL